MITEAGKSSAAMKLLTLLLLLALPAVAQNQFTFTTNNGAITITGITYIAVNGVVAIPSETNGYPVTSIGTNAFYDLTILTSVTIPNSVSNIEDSAFGQCTSLKNVTFGSGLTNIGNSAFEGCFSLTNAPIPGSVTTIGMSAFEFCSSLTKITIGSIATNIGEQAFAYCTGLTNITVNPANESYSSLSGVMFDKSQTTLLQYPGGKDGSYTISNNVTTIGDYAFADCSSLTGITIPDNITNIGIGSFSGCSRLTGVAISGTVASIGVGAFGFCSSLMSITVNATNAFYSNEAGVLFDKSQTTLLQYPCGKVGSYAISNSVTSIEVGSFASCSGLTNVTIPDSVTSIGGLAFQGCTSLTNLTIGSGLTSIGLYAFSFCTSLTGVYFQGNSPTPSDDLTVFSDDNTGTVYYLAGTTGWGTLFDGWPTTLLAANIAPFAISGGSFNIQPNEFSFTITSISNQDVVVQGCTNLANPVWIPLATNSLTIGTNYFSDSEWTNYPKRFYRIRETLN